MHFGISRFTFSGEIITLTVVTTHMAKKLSPAQVELDTHFMHNTTQRIPVRYTSETQIRRSSDSKFHLDFLLAVAVRNEATISV